MDTLHIRHMDDGSVNFNAPILGYTFYPHIMDCGKVKPLSAREPGRIACVAAPRLAFRVVEQKGNLWRVILSDKMSSTRNQT